MLQEIGVASIENLFDSIPEDLRLLKRLNVPAALSEIELLKRFGDVGARNTAASRASFLGAGAYSHYVPTVVDHLISRSEFFTAYTPYQPEISQGTLQSIFEFQTLVCQLTGMEIANASMYDGSTALAEAVLMAERVTRRSKVIASSAIHPQYLEVAQTYVQHAGIELQPVPFDLVTGQTPTSAFDTMDAQTAAVVVQSPNFFGAIEDVAAIAEIAHKHGAMLVVSIAEAVSLGIVEPPRQADIIAMEAQSFGVPLGFGGPYCGVIATREKYVRQMPGRLVGQTVDKQGKRGFVLTLATREQHIRREKATSNICTNQALVALMVNIFMTVYGKVGLKELAKQNLAKSAYAATQFAKHGKVLFTGSPRFNEFVVTTSEDPYAVNSRLLGHKIVGGLPLRKFYPELGNAALWCCTELTTRSAIDTAAGLIAESERSVRTAKEEVEEMAR